MERKEGKEGVDLDQFLRLLTLDFFDWFLNVLCKLVHFLEELAVSDLLRLRRLLSQLHLR